MFMPNFIFFVSFNTPTGFYIDVYKAKFIDLFKINSMVIESVFHRGHSSLYQL